MIVERSAARRTGEYFVGIFGSGRASAERLGIASHLHDRLPHGVAYDYDRRGNRRVGMRFADLPGDAWTALRWHDHRVVLVGDAAWCETLRSGLGVSSSLAGLDLLGSMLDRYPDDLDRALIEWERTLRPFIDSYQQFGVRQRFFFTPDNRVKLLFRQAMTRLRQMPFTRRLLALIAEGSKAGQLKDQDIAGDQMFRQATADAFAKGAGNATRSTIGTGHR